MLSIKEVLCAGFFCRFAVIFAASLAVPLRAQGAPPQVSADQPYTIEYYYKCQWAIRLSSRISSQEHYPLLKRFRQPAAFFRQD